MGLFSSKKKKREEQKIKELTGSLMSLSEEYKLRLKERGISKTNGSNIQMGLISEVRRGELAYEDIEKRLEECIEFHAQHDKITVKNKEEIKMDKTLSEIREGIPIAVYKMIEGEKNKHGDVVKGLSSLGWGIAGYALTSGKVVGVHETFIESVLKVVPKGLVVTSVNETDIRIPYEKIIHSSFEVTMRGYKFSVKLVDGEYLNFITKYMDYEELNQAINKNACGVVETGWE